MENKNIILLRHHPLNVKFTNSFYTSQVDDDINDYVIVDVTSRVGANKKFLEKHPNFDKEVSPFYLGPVVTSDGTICYVFEHYWQCGKVYPCHYKDNQLTSDYFEWRNKWYSKLKLENKKSTRYPSKELGYNPGDCLFNVIYENGEYKHLNYIESRKKLYIPEYAKLVVKTNSYKWLKSLVDEGKKIALVDFDAYNYYSSKAMIKRYESFLNKYKNTNLTVSDFTSIKTINDCINTPFLASGHASILKMLLEGDIEVLNDKVIDHIGILK